MMANYEIVKFIAVMQRSIDKCIQFSSESVCTDAFSKQRNEKKICVTFLFLLLNSKNLSFDTFRHSILPMSEVTGRNFREISACKMCRTTFHLITKLKSVQILAIYTMNPGLINFSICSQQMSKRSQIETKLRYFVRDMFETKLRIFKAIWDQD